MKKSLVALAVLAAAGAASAQSSVTLFGIVDASVSYYDAKTNLGAGGSTKQKQWGLSNSGYNSSRLGFRGTEDLGGGLAASFWLEAALGNDNGSTGGNALLGQNANNTAGGAPAAATNVLFNRRSTVSLSGGFGEIRLGRDFTPTFWNDTNFDPFGTNGVGTNVLHATHNQLVGAVGLPFNDNSYIRSSNSVGYFLPSNLGGFYGQVQYAFGENVKQDGVSLSKTGEYAGGRFGYANGPIDVAVAYGQSRNADFATAESKVKTFNLAASYDLGVVKLFGEVSQVKNSIETLVGSADPKINGFLLGATAPIGAGLIRVAYSQAKTDLDLAGFADPRARKLAIGYVHNLSKRTALYATAAHINNKDGSAALNSSSGGNVGFVPGIGNTAGSANGYDFGIRHSF